MEEALGAEGIRALHAQCRTLGIPLTKWHLVQQFASAWENLAVVNLADAIERDGSARKTAEETAALRLGLNPDSVRTRLYRWRREAYTRAA
jgi:hypothetical protein